MKHFVRVSAVLVALGNWYALAVGWNPPTSLARSDWPSLLPGSIIFAVLGLITAEVLLRLAQPLLKGGFLARYIAMATAPCVGGMLYGLLIAIMLSLASSPSSVIDVIGLTLVAGLIAVVAGGAIGLAEGLVLGVPLAAVLGLFRDGE